MPLPTPAAFVTLQGITFVAGLLGFTWLAFLWARVAGRWFMLAGDSSLSAWYKVPPFCFFSDRLLGGWLVLASSDTLLTLLTMRTVVKMIPSAAAAYIGAVLGIAVSVLFRLAIGGAFTGPKPTSP